MPPYMGPYAGMTEFDLCRFLGAPDAIEVARYTFMSVPVNDVHPSEFPEDASPDEYGCIEIRTLFYLALDQSIVIRSGKVDGFWQLSSRPLQHYLVRRRAIPGYRDPNFDHLVSRSFP